MMHFNSAGDTGVDTGVRFGTGSTPSRGNVIVVDDNRDAADALCAVLGLSGYQVWAIPSGVAAASHPALTVADVVLIDLGMPLMNGFQLADVIKRKPRTDVLLIAVTGWKRPDDDAAARAAGFDHYFTKPVDTDLLDSYIGRFLAEHPRNRASAFRAASDVGTQAPRVGEPA